MDIDQIPGGRQMDGLISEHVFGNKSCVCCHGATCSRCDCPKYSTDIAAAWEVVLNLYRKGVPTPTVNAFSGGWYCSFGPEANATVKNDKLGAPLAICRAALRVVSR